MISFDIVNGISPSSLTNLFETYQPTTTIILILELVLVGMNLCLYTIPIAMLIHEKVLLPK